MEFKDRVANKPNRIKLTYEDGGASVYATVELADEPIEEGTPLNAINMNKLLNKENNDYIVEQGTSGIWSYRKWASGECELYGTNVVTADTTIQEENVWRSEKIGVELPFTVYNHSAFFNTEGHRSWCSGSNFDLDVLTIYYVIYHTIFYEGWESKTHILIKGRWK